MDFLDLVFLDPGSYRVARRADEHAAETQGQLRDVSDEIGQLRDEVAELRRLVQLLLMISSKASGLSEEQITEVIREWEKRTAPAHGSARVKRCPMCARPNPPNWKTCMYCEAVLTDEIVEGPGAR
jgi:hypothetical protein